MKSSGVKSTSKAKKINEPLPVQMTDIPITNGLDVAVSFDTTGSMYPVLGQVRASVSKMVKTLFEELEDIRIGVIAHGDYCDANNPYTIRIMDFTKDHDKICEFIRLTAATSGGDSPECYELVLNQARTSLSWGSGREKVLMVIGDANPHEPSYPENKNRLDWRNEAGLLAEAGVKIFSVHALANYRSSSKAFYKAIAEKSGGKYLTLDNFNEINSLIMATCYSQYCEEKLNHYVSIIRTKGRLNRGMVYNLNTLIGSDTILYDSKTYTALTGLNPVPSGRFQIFPVNEASSIKQFLDECGVVFKTGRTFYELVKPETVQQYKEIILEDKNTGELFYGADVRVMLNLLPECKRSGDYAKEKLKPAKGGEYTVFVQSTSYNRKLPENTRILYEVPDWDVETPALY